MSLDELSLLIVDDDELLLKLMSASLQDFGARQVATTGNGHDVLARLAGGEHFDVILIDLNMPEMDGIELMRHLAERQYPGGVILLTGEHLKVLRAADALAEAHDLRLLGVLQKPFSRAALRTFLEGAGYAGEEASPQNEPPAVTADELAAALRDGQIVPYFQPRAATSGRQVVGVEALARWWHPHKGLINPGVFIPLAERSGLIRELGQVMLKAAVEQVGAWCEAGLDLKVSVNVAVEDLVDVQLPDRLATWLRAAGVHPSRLVLELTESQLMDNLRLTLDTLIRLRLKGITLAVDDFGTGYSNLGQIKRAPFSELKIDRAFVSDGTVDPEGRAILEASILMGKHLGLTVVAEGVETQAEWEVVSAIGADEVQGYLVAKPMPGHEIPAWVGHWHGNGNPVT
ncbi:MAG: EAL domain-containing response regulator [Candidatus Thiodiazotropha taylori]